MIEEKGFFCILLMFLKNLLTQTIFNHPTPSHPNLFKNLIFFTWFNFKFDFFLQKNNNFFKSLGFYVSSSYNYFSLSLTKRWSISFTYCKCVLVLPILPFSYVHYELCYKIYTYVHSIYICEHFLLSILYITILEKVIFRMFHWIENGDEREGVWGRSRWCRW